MSRLLVFGTSCGIEPVPGRRHTAFAIAREEDWYLFDAGENCGYAAAMLGLDLTRLRGIFLTHAHMDHVGGLADMLWYLRREVLRRGLAESFTLPLYVPEPEAAQCVLALLRITDEGFHNPFTVVVRCPQDGPVFDVPGLAVTALHNGHKRGADGGCLSCGYAVDIGKTRVVYTGDMMEIAECFALLPCDVLITEDAHLRAWQTARALRESSLFPRRALLFLHHGYETLRDFEGELARARAVDARVRFLNDGDILPLSPMGAPPDGGS